MRKAHSSHISYIEQVVEKAKAEGYMDGAIDSISFANIVIGILREICLIWRINKYNFCLRERTEEALTIVLKGIT